MLSQEKVSLWERATTNTVYMSPFFPKHSENIKGRGRVEGEECSFHDRVTPSLQEAF